MSADIREGSTSLVTMGQFATKADAVTPITTWPGTTIKLDKRGAAFGNRHSATTPVHSHDGYFSVELDATDSNTRGPMRASASDPTSYQSVYEDFNVLSQSEYDLKYSPTYFLQSATSLGGVLDAGASSVNDTHTGQVIWISGGPGAGQVRRLTSYNGTTKGFAIDLAWVTLPTSASSYVLLGAASVFLSPVERTAIADAYNNRTDGVETDMTPKEAMRVMLAMLTGRSVGNGTNTIIFKDPTGAISRVTMTVNSGPDRTNVVLVKT